MSKSKNKNLNRSSNSASGGGGCFSTILQRFICTGNLPTHPSPIPDKPHIINNVDNDDSIIVVQTQAHRADDDQASSSPTPGIVARLMGLDSLPARHEYNTKLTTSNSYESLFRSKSLNSLHFLPDFNPIRGPSLCRGARTSASFHEQSHNTTFVVEVDESLRSNGVKKKEKEKRENLVVVKGNERRKIRENGSNYNKRRYEEGCSSRSRIKKSLDSGSSSSSSVKFREKYAMQKKKLEVSTKGRDNVNGKNGSTSSSNKRRVDHKEKLCGVDLQSDALSLSPISVLDHLPEFDSPSSSREEPRQEATSNSRRKSSAKIKLYDDVQILPQDSISMPKSKKNVNCLNRISGSKDKLMKSETEVAEYFVGLMGEICKLAEEQIRDPKWNTQFEGVRVHFVDELCMDFGQEMLENLLVEAIFELIE